MQPEAVGPLQITDDDIDEARPRVRALLIARFEALWQPVRVRLSQDSDGQIPIDPRLLEIGIRINKELGLLYRMYRPPAPRAEDDEEEGAGIIDRAAEVDRQLLELENKLRSQGS